MKFAAVSLAAFSLSVCLAVAAETGPAVYEKGRQALAKGDLATARQCFERLLAADPNFLLAKAQLAQVAVAEKELARIPATLKLARKTSPGGFSVEKAALDETLTLFRRKLETAGGGEKVLPINLTGVLPQDVAGRAISLKAKDATFDHLLQAIGYAGGVSFSYLPNGIAVSTGGSAEFPAGNAKEPTLRAAARKLNIGQLTMNEADVSEALAYLQLRAEKASNGQVKPFFVIRHDSTPRRGVTLDLRNVSLEEAVRAVCLVADCEETWFPWGAGIGNAQPKAANPGPEDTSAVRPAPSDR
jgi:tetratricopeptide (TPR) repeat protein